MVAQDLLKALERLVPLMPGYAYLLDELGSYKCCTPLQAIAFGLNNAEDIANKTNSNLPLFQKHPELLNTLDTSNRQLMQTKTPQMCDEPIIDSNGQLTLLHYQKIPLLDKKQKVIGLLCMSPEPSTQPILSTPNDIAFKNILTHLPGHVYWKDTEGKYLGCNLAQAKDLNLNTCEDIIGKTDYDFSTKDKADLFQAIDKQVISLGRTIDAEEEIMTLGQKRIVLSKKTPLYDEQNTIIGLLGISIDITDRKEMEKKLHHAKEAAEAANEAKSEFLANMRHDVRTPLSGIVGFSELLKSESQEPRIKEYADNLVASSHALLDLMDEVLEAVRVSSGDIPILKRKFDLRQTIEKVVALHRARSHQKKVDLTLHFDSSLPQFVIGDKIRIHRIVLELVGNGLNFTDKGHVAIHVTCAKKEDRHLVIKVTVSDSGMGIPKDKQQEIYLQFKRLTPSYQGIYKGAGLGLYVVKQFIDELEGEIYIESEVHKGTCFTCLIPLQKPLLDDASGMEQDTDFITEYAYMAPLTNQITPQLEQFESKSKSQLLVVEDNFIAQTVAKTLLSAMNCEVDVASNGVDALALCAQKQYDLIFMDIGLGDGMDGYEVTHYIRSKANRAIHTPIIALTAHAGDESKQRCIEAGMDAVLTKPLTQAYASDILKSFISSRITVPTEPQIKKRDLPDKDEEMFQLNQFAILNYEEALINCGTKEMLKELLTLMIQELPKDLDTMKRAFIARDYPLVEKIAHKIKGGAVYVGTDRMKYACQYVERYWKSGERELFEALYLQAVNTIEETIIFIEGWMRR